MAEACFQSQSIYHGFNCFEAVQRSKRKKDGFVARHGLPVLALSDVGQIRKSV